MVELEDACFQLMAFLCVFHEDYRKVSLSNTGELSSKKSVGQITVCMTSSGLTACIRQKGQDPLFKGITFQQIKASY